MLVIFREAFIRTVISGYLDPMKYYECLVRECKPSTLLRILLFCMHSCFVDQIFNNKKVNGFTSGNSITTVISNKITISKKIGITVWYFYG